MKRILCLSVIAAILLSLVPITAVAETYGDLTYEIYEDHIIITGCNPNAVSVDIPAEIDGLPVTEIGEGAFLNCDSLKSITIPNSVTSISDSVFHNTAYYNDGSNWQNGVLYIGDCLIEANSDELPSDYTIKNGTRVIADYAFSDCYSLENVTIANSVISIGRGAFGGCDSLTSVTIPNSVIRIGNSAFAYSDNLTSITIGNGVTSIGGDAFYGTAYYNDVSNWQNRVLYIDNCLIGVDYEGLPSSYEINDGTRVIADCAFAFCDNLLNITIPSSVTNIGESVFAGCGSLNISVDSGNKNYSDINGVLFNKDKTELIAYTKDKVQPEYSIPDRVTSIGYRAFENCESLTSVTISNSVTSIGEMAFEDCDSLTSITIPNSVTSIGYGAFEGCESLTDITIPDSVTSIVNYVFLGCYSLTSITIPSSVTSIGDYAFSSCGLTSVTIPDSVTSIGDWAFEDCESLTSVTIPSSVTSIGEMAFYGCYSLTSVTIPSSVTSIGYGAFESCKSLTDITVDNQNKYYCSIDGNLFDKDKKTLIQYAIGKQDSQYTIPSSVISIGDYAFSNCSLTSITIPDSVTSIGEGAFEYCHSLTSVTIPNSVTSIGEMAFAFCESLTDITLGNGITSIAAWAFADCGLTSVTIPNSVTSIGDWAFAFCESLTDITLGNGITSIGDWAFDGCDSLTDVYYSGSETDWKKIYIGDYNECLTDAAIHYNSVIDTEPTKFASMPTVSAGGNEEYTVSVSLQDIDTDCVMVAVIYDGKTLTGASAVNLSEGQTEASASVSAVQADKAKVFIWESIDGMKPLCHPQAVNIR